MEYYRKFGEALIPKKKFDTLEDAIAEAKIINFKESQIHKVVAYKCKICMKYHIGKNNTIIKHSKDIWLNQ